LENDGDINSINKLLNFVAKHYVNKLALATTNGLHKTYQELLDDISLARGYLNKQNIKKGDVVCLQMNNEYNFAVYFLAVTTLGAIANSVPMQMPLEVVDKIVTKNKAKLVIYSNVIAGLYQT
jgi:acyl-coenzyme A synthetase/AMP-(fatty) acid ligase